MSARGISWMRTGLILLFVLAFIPALAPFSRTTFDEGVQDFTWCVPVADGWASSPKPPSQEAVRLVVEELARSSTFMGEQHTKAERDAFIASMTRFEQTASYKEVTAYTGWLNGPGVCVNESRHRLIVTGLAIAAATVIAVTVTFVRRRRPRIESMPEREDHSSGT